MRGMEKRRRVTVELSVNPYRIVYFDGEPDHSFAAGVEKECPGLPPVGAAAFTASGKGEIKGFPRSQVLRRSETFALLWNKPAEPGFPDELVVDKLHGRKEWNLALVTIPDNPSPKCIDWLLSFTGLRVASPVPSIKFVWPFLARNLSINTVECARSNIVLLSAEMIPIGQYDSGPTMQAKSASACLSAVGVEHSPAFFALKPDSADAISVVEANNSDIESIISCSLHPEHTQEQPAVELAFMTSQEVLRVFPLHRRNCAEVAAEARARGMGPEYLSMPAGARGNLYVNGPVGRNEIALCSGCDASPHSKHMRLLPPDVQAQLSSALADPAYDVEIDFGGFGRLCLTSSHAEDIRRKLDSGLRNRLLSFMFQLRLGAPTAVYADDMALVEALAAIKPGQSLITHYRLLVREVLACGFKSKYFGQSVLP